MEESFRSRAPKREIQKQQITKVKGVLEQQHLSLISDACHLLLASASLAPGFISYHCYSPPSVQEIDC